MQCRVVSIWEDAHDQAMEQGDGRSLPLRKVEEMFADLVAGLLRPKALCSDFRSTGVGDDLDCIFLHGHLCIRKMPLCTGACPSDSSRDLRSPEQPEYI